MKIVLAAVAADAGAVNVLAVARGLAPVLDAEVRALHVGDPRSASATGLAPRLGTPIDVVDGEPEREIDRAVADHDVVAAVVGVRGRVEGARPAGHVATSILQRCDKPVVVVPPDLVHDGASWVLGRALVPLEGSVESSEGIAATVAQLGAAGVEIVVLHVFDAATVPSFWGEPEHTERSFTAAFRARWCSVPEAEVRIRRGSAAEAVLGAAVEEQVDLIALGWRRDLSTGRAAVVRAAISDARVPVLLVPAGPVAV